MTPHNPTTVRGKTDSKRTGRKLNPILPIGRLMPWTGTTRNNFRRASVTASSSPSTGHGIGRHMSKAATTLFFNRSPGTADRARCEIFADGFAGAVKSPAKAAHRPTGLAVGPDGSLYVSDDIRGRVYRIVYRGGVAGGSRGRAAELETRSDAAEPATTPLAVWAQPPAVPEP